MTGPPPDVQGAAGTRGGVDRSRRRRSRIAATAPTPATARPIASPFIGERAAWGERGLPWEPGTASTENEAFVNTSFPVASRTRASIDGGNLKEWVRAVAARSSSRPGCKRHRA
jgi:hypothetical protein